MFKKSGFFLMGSFLIFLEGAMLGSSLCETRRSVALGQHIRPDMHVQQLGPVLQVPLHPVMPQNIVVQGNNAIIHNMPVGGGSQDWQEWFLEFLTYCVESIEWFCEEFSGLKHE